MRVSPLRLRAPVCMSSPRRLPTIACVVAMAARTRVRVLAEAARACMRVLAEAARTRVHVVTVVVPLPRAVALRVAVVR